MPLQLLIGGVDRTSYLMHQTLSITDQVNGNSTASFDIVDPEGLYRPEVGEEILIYDEVGTLIFGGSVDEPEEDTRRTSALFTTVQATDHHQLADRRLVAEAYDNELAGDIVRDIIIKVLSAEGITAGNIQNGPTITRAVFNYLTASQALEELSGLTGYQWVIRPDKSLDFFNRATFTAPWDADDSAPLIQPKVRKSREAYRNRQYVRAGQDISDPRTERFKGDGETQTFVLSMPVATVPTVALNGNPQTVGIQGVESGKQWYWNKGRNEISQDGSDTPITSADTLEVTYRGLYPIIVVADQASAQLERQAVESGSGIYEQVEDQPNLDSQAAAMEFAQGRLRRFARISTTLTYGTYQSDLRPGMLQTVDLTRYNLSGQFLISQIATIDAGRADGKLLRQVTALSGEAVGGWIPFYRALVQAGRQFVIRENELLIKLLQLSDSIACIDDLVVSSGAPESRVGYAMIGYGETA